MRALVGVICEERSRCRKGNGRKGALRGRFARAASSRDAGDRKRRWRRGREACTYRSWRERATSTLRHAGSLMMRAVAAKRAFTDKTMTRGRKEKEGETNLFPCVGQGYRGERERKKRLSIRRIRHYARLRTVSKAKLREGALRYARPIPYRSRSRISASR